MTKRGSGNLPKLGASAADEERLRQAAKRIEQGIERYAAGDIAAATAEFEEALRLQPAHELATRYLGWVRALQSGAAGDAPTTPPASARPGGSAPPLDEDVLRVLSDALDLGAPAVAPTPPKTPSSDGLDWQLSSTSLAKLAGVVLTSAPLPPPVRAPHLDEKTARRLPETPWDAPSSTPTPRPAPQTLQGVPPPAYMPPLGDDDDEPTGETTRRWSSPTLRNLPPLDVPELTDDQLQGLIEVEETFTDEASAGRTGNTASYGKIDDPRDEPEPTLPAGPPAISLPTMRPEEPTFETDLPTSTFMRVDAARPTPSPDKGDPSARPPARRREHTRDKDTSETPALPPLPSVEAALERSDAKAAFTAAEQFIAECGGLDGAGCRPHHWLLERVYELFLGKLDRVPVFGTATSDLDPKAAFMLSRVDGMTNIDDLLEVSGMPRLEALRLVALLVHKRALKLAG